MCADGTTIVMGTAGGWLYAFDSRGEVLWQRPLWAELRGHNALDVTPDGWLIAVGTAGMASGGQVLLLDRNGTLMWSHRSYDRRELSLGTSDHNQTGVIAVAISDDGSRIAAGYGDSVIRIFEREP